MSCLWKHFPDKMFYQKIYAKTAHIFFGSWLDISTFQTYFTKSNTLTDGQFFLVITHWTYTCLSPWALNIIVFRDCLSSLY